VRYELDGNGYVCKVFFGCMSGLCEEYTGTVPEGYETLEDWAVSTNIRAYKIVDGNLVYDAERDEELQAEWANNWKTPELIAFKAYNNDNEVAPQYRRTGDIVEIRGQVAPTSEIASGGTAIIFILPEGYRPSKSVFTLCQGSGKNSWLLQVYADGRVTFGRYGTNANASCPTSAWLPFYFTFLVD